MSAINEVLVADTWVGELAAAAELAAQTPVNRILEVRP